MTHALCLAPDRSAHSAQRQRCNVYRMAASPSSGSDVSFGFGTPPRGYLHEPLFCVLCIASAWRQCFNDVTLPFHDGAFAPLLMLGPFLSSQYHPLRIPHSLKVPADQVLAELSWLVFLVALFSFMISR
eukprot:m.634484 g.634484  ORF g.634484 m.634484 type:complete len:129 (+) comp58302_c0_seq2:341-727(+)